MTLACRLDAAAGPDGTVSLTFTVTNPGAETVVLRRMEPFTAFALRAWVSGSEVTVAIPPTSLQVQPTETRLAPGEALTLTTPVYLRFDPDALYGAGEDMFAWRLASEPGPLELEATLSFDGFSCSARAAA